MDGDAFWPCECSKHVLEVRELGTTGLLGRVLLRIYRRHLDILVRKPRGTLGACEESPIETPRGWAINRHR